MPIEINGNGTITGISTGGLPDGTVDADTLAANAVTTAKIGYNGAILQVQTAVKSNTSSVTGYSWTDTGLSVSIEPVAASSKILVLADMNIGGDNMYDIKLRLLRGSTAIGLGDTVGSRPQATRVTNFYIGSGDSQYVQAPTTIIYLDEPTYTLTDSITYKVQFATYDLNIGYLNRSGINQADTSNEYEGTPASFITVMEVSD